MWVCAVSLVNQQLQGIVDGYTRYAPASQALTYEQLMVRAQSVTSWFFFRLLISVE